LILRTLVPVKNRKEYHKGHKESTTKDTKGTKGTKKRTTKGTKGTKGTKKRTTKGTKGTKDTKKSTTKDTKGTKKSTKKGRLPSRAEGAQRTPRPGDTDGAFLGRGRRTRKGGAPPWFAAAQPLPTATFARTPCTRLGGHAHLP
jgi:hypothetical protein